MLWSIWIERNDLTLNNNMCHDGTENVWKYLARRPRLCKNLCGEKRSRIPREQASMTMFLPNMIVCGEEMSLSNVGPMTRLFDILERLTFA